MALVSVIIPSYKSDDCLIRAVNSVLSQTYKDIEVIVVDDNNPDSNDRKRTTDMMTVFKSDDRVRYICHVKNMNGSAARNTGIKAANGVYISFLDDDDVYYEQRIEKCVSALSDNPEAMAVYTAVDVNSKDRTWTVEAKAEGKIWKDLMLNTGLLGTGSNLFLRKSAVDEIGFFDTGFLRYQDVEFMLRFTYQYPIIALNEPLVRKNEVNRNIPDYDKFRKNKSIIFSKFDWMIAQLSEEERKTYYSKHYKELFESALAKGTHEQIHTAASELSQVRELTTKERISGRFPTLVRIYRKIRN
ncbi:MAG: glycosyltransferase [Oscillospiraceae bacterium]|nr:glycosyltransferase [Oscillospiraceae bacterium]